MLGLWDLQAEPRANDAKNRKVHNTFPGFQDWQGGPALAFMNERFFFSQDYLSLQEPLLQQRPYGSFKYV